MRNGVLREKLVRLDAGCLEDCAPLRELGADEGVALLRAAAHELEALRGEPRFHLRVLRDLRHFAVQAIDDRARRARWRGEAVPAVDLEARQPAFRDRRNLGRERGALRAG